MTKKNKGVLNSTAFLAIITFLVLLGFSLFNPLNNETAETESAKKTQTSSGSYEVLKVIDGDTIKIDYEGNVETLRLIGIDTPELGNSNETKECFAEEAQEKLAELIGENQITFEDDPSQGDADRYGRYLMYIFVNGVNLNQKMLELGYAYEYTYDTPYKYQEAFKEAEETARTEKLGLWSETTCNGERLTVSDN